MTTATQSEFAAILGKDKSHVTRLKQAGRLVLAADGLVDVEKSKALIAATADPSRNAAVEARANEQMRQERAPAATRTAPSAETIGNSFQQFKAVNEKYKALTAKTEYEQLIGKLIDKDEAFAAMEDVVAFARQGVENLPHRVAAQLVGKDFEQIVAILRGAIGDNMAETHKEAGKRLAELVKVEA